MNVQARESLCVTDNTCPHDRWLEMWTEGISDRLPYEATTQPSQHYPLHTNNYTNYEMQIYESYLFADTIKNAKKI